jgi:hypothetical protein
VKRKWFSDLDGGVLFDEMAQATPSFQSILADGEVTDDELVGQASKTSDLFRELDARLPPDLHDLAGRAITELAVLYAIQAHRQTKEVR